MAVAFHWRFFSLNAGLFSVAIQTPEEEIKRKINQN